MADDWIKSALWLQFERDYDKIITSYQDVTVPRGVFFKRTLAPVPSKQHTCFAPNAVFETRELWLVLVGLRGTHSKAAFGD